MAQLAEPVKAEAKVVVAEGVGHAEFLLRRHAYFQFMLGASICNNFPIVLSVHEWSIGDHSTEKVVGFVEECVAVIT